MAIQGEADRTDAGDNDQEGVEFDAEAVGHRNVSP